MDQNIDFENIKTLSKSEVTNTIDPIVVYNRLKSIDSETWKKVIALGEQANKLTFNQISVIKTIIQKLKTQENIDLKRLKIVSDALDEIKKFGINV